MGTAALDLEQTFAIPSEAGFKRMQQYLDSMNASLTSRNWFAALAVALTIPDIVVWLQNGTQQWRAAYVTWSRKYIEPKYMVEIGPQRLKTIFLPAEDLYALRCAYLHRGIMDITDQKMRKAVQQFRFIMPNNPGVVIHNNRINTQLQLQVNMFCSDIEAGLRAWMTDYANDAAVQGRIANLPFIEIVGDSFQL